MVNNTREQCIKARVGGEEMDSGRKGAPKKLKRGRKVRTGRAVERRPDTVYSTRRGEAAAGKKKA